MDPVWILCGSCVDPVTYDQQPLIFWCVFSVSVWDVDVRWGGVRWGEVGWDEVRWGEVRLDRTYDCTQQQYPSWIAIF